jgi:hypothetical protein
MSKRASDHDRKNAASATKDAFDTHRKLQETAVASAEVIARRTAMGAAAMTAPSFESAAEAGLMVSEKANAMARSSAALAGSSFEAADRNAKFVAAEFSSAARDAAEIAGAATPMDAMAAQQRAIMGLFGRMASHGLAMSALMLKGGAAAVEPYHSASTRNAKRLRKAK